MEPTTHEGGQDPRLVALGDEFTRRLDAGEDVDVDAFCAAAPSELQDELRGMCETLRAVHSALARSAPRGAEFQSKLFEGRYRTLSRLGQGGMGVVFRALDLVERRDVALKVIHPHLVDSLRARERFRREAVAAMRLDHPNIVRVYDHGEGDEPFLVMQLGSERSLHQQLEEQRERSELPSTSDQFRAVARQIAAVADALETAHRSGILHRDVKPGNILVDAEGTPQLADFGLAYAESDEHLTRTGDLTGTPHYMSPEQLLAQRVRVDHRSDIYSLGVVLYEMLTLERPFSGDSAERLIFDITFRAPVPVNSRNRAVPRDLETICLHALEKSPEQRFATAGELRDDLLAFAQGRAIRSRPPWLGYPLRLALRRVFGPHKPLIATAAAVLVGAFGWALIQGAPPPATARIEVRSDRAGDRVLVQRVRLDEPGIDPPDERGVTPASLDVEPGCWRVIVVRDGFGIAELTRFVPAAGARALADAVVRPAADACAGMILVPAGSAIVGAGPQTMDITTRYDDRTVDLPAFYLDRTEVSNGEYRAFLAATGHPAPAHWRFEADAEWDRKPVIGVRWWHAQEYAEWAGKRLPTWHEWQRAYRGEDGRHYPWGDERGDVNARAVVGRLRPSQDETRVWDEAQPWLLAVDAPLDDRTWCGALHMLGNAGEWTESFFIHETGIGVQPDLTSRILMGCCWRTTMSSDGVAIGIAEASAETTSDIGFRCARSAVP